MSKNQAALEDDPDPRKTDGTRFQLNRKTLLLFGFTIGLIAALYYAWIIEPVVYVSASPSRFNERFKSEYLLLVSESYAADKNWELAQARLEALEEQDIQQRVSQELEAYLRRGESASRMRNMADLAQSLGADSVAIGIFIPQQLQTSTPNPTLLPTPERTRIPSRTPETTPANTPFSTATPRPKYRLLSQEKVCLAEYPAPQIQVEAVDANLDPLAGVEVIVQWSEGVDHFFTGFQPERGAGYGDFDMEPEIDYQVYLAQGSPTVEGIKVETCLESEGGWPGGWRLTFQDTELIEEDPLEPDR